MTARLAEPKPVGPRGTMNPERAAKCAAKRIGCTANEYLTRRAGGEKWCCVCKAWHSCEAFSRDRARGDGLANYCREAYRARFAYTEVCVDCGGPRHASSGQRCAGCYAARATQRRLDAIKERGRRIVERCRRAVASAKAWAVAKAQRRLDLERVRAARQRRVHLESLRAEGARIVRDCRRMVVRTRAWISKQLLLAERAAERERVRGERLEAKQLLQAQRAANRKRAQAKRRARWDIPVYRTPWEAQDRTNDPFQGLLSSELHRIVGDMTVADAEAMGDHERQRLVEKLAAAGLVDIAVEKAERERITPKRRTKHRTVNRWHDIEEIGGLDESDLQEEAFSGNPGQGHRLEPYMREKRRVREYRTHKKKAS